MFSNSIKSIKDSIDVRNESVAELTQIQNANEMFIAKIMIMGGYSREDVMSNIATYLKANDIVFDSDEVEHWHTVTHFLHNVISERAGKTALKENMKDVYLKELDPIMFTYVDFQKELTGVEENLPSEVKGLLRVLS